MPQRRPLLSLTFPYRVIGDAATCQVVLLNIVNNERISVLEQDVLSELLGMEAQEEEELASQKATTISGLKLVRRKPSNLRLISWFLLLKSYQDAGEEVPQKAKRIQTLEAMLEQEEGQGVALKCLHALRHVWAGEAFSASWLGTRKSESNTPLSLAFVAGLSEDPMQSLRGVLRNLLLHRLLSEYRENKTEFQQRLPDIVETFNRELAILLAERRAPNVA
jgi:hypothetical protein